VHPRLGGSLLIRQRPAERSRNRCDGPTAGRVWRKTQYCFSKQPICQSESSLTRVGSAWNSAWIPVLRAAAPAAYNRSVVVWARSGHGGAHREFRRLTMRGERVPIVRVARSGALATGNSSSHVRRRLGRFGRGGNRKIKRHIFVPTGRGSPALGGTPGSFGGVLAWPSAR